MKPSRSLSSFADALVPPRGESASVERFRGRAMVLTLLLSAGAAVTSAPVYWLTGMWLTALATTTFGCAALGLFWAFRGGLPTLTTFYSLLGLTAAFMLASSAVESPLDSSGLTWSLIFPVSGYLLGGQRGGLWGSFIAVATTLASLTLHAAGLVLAVQGPVNGTVMVVRFGALFVGIALMTATFEALRAQAMAEASLSSRAKSLFLANMSHELRTPMNGVLGLTELVLQGHLEAEQRERLELVQRSGQALIGIIDNILHLTKIESGGLRLEALQVDLRQLLGDAVALHGPAASARHLALRADIAADLPARLVGDPTRLSQIVNNLLGNAIKFTEHGSVTLFASTRGGELVLAVRDTGIGIPLAAQGTLFKNFHQLDETFTRRFGGTGLGLSISRQLAKAMGGEITLVSVPGAGSTFTLVVPLRAVEPAAPGLAPATPPAAPTPFAGSLLPVLIVDDNSINLRVARGFVEKLGLQAQTAVNGLEAVALASEHRYLFVLMDCHMPQLDGFQATERIRALPAPFSEVPIVAVTASVMEEDLEACQRAGMNQVLAKPLSLASLEAMARQLLAR